MSNRRTPLYRFLAPRFWPVWLGLGLVRLAVLLPYRAQLAFGRSLGRIALRVMGSRRRVAERNLALCFPELDEAGRADLLARHFESLGIALIEAGLCWWAPAEKIRPLVTIEGLEHLREALGEGHGVIMLTGHFTTLDLGGRFVTMEAPVSAMYRPHSNELFEEIMRRGRERSALVAIPKQDVRGMIKALRRNEAIWYAPDQSHRRKHSAMIPFFGVPAPTNTATSAFARMSGALVVPFFPERLPDGRGYRVEILPPLEDFPTDDPEADALRVNKLLEERIRRVPDQYLWIHRRFKPMGPDSTDHYAGLER